VLFRSIEVTALSKIFGLDTNEKEFCALGSAKSNIGHCEAAAGIAGLSKILLQMRHGQIAPSLHSSTLNPHIDFANSPFKVNQKLRDWERPKVDGKMQARVAGLSSFGAGGSNAHMIVEEYVSTSVSQKTPLAVLVVLSARTLEQLKTKVEDLFSYLSTHDEVDMSSLSYTLQTGREAMAYRLGVIADSAQVLSTRLEMYLIGESIIEDVYAGNIEQGQDTLSLFGSDKDLQSAVNKWISQEQWSRLLSLWVKGLPLDWSSLYACYKVQKMSLPGYPFAKERYWLKNPSVLKQEVKQVATSAVLHPLLHRNRSNLKYLSYCSQFSGDEFYLSNASMPTSAYLEMAHAALNDAFTESADESVIVLKSVAFGRPYAVHTATELLLALLPSDAGEVGFEIYSQPEGEAESIHCQGYGYLGDAKTRVQIDLKTPGLKPVAVELLEGGLLAPLLTQQILLASLETPEQGQWNVLEIGEAHIFGACSQTMYVQVDQ